MLLMADPIEQVTSRLQRWGNFYELDGAPLRRTVGHAPQANLLDQLDQLNANLLGLKDTLTSPPDARRVRKSVGKVR